MTTSLRAERIIGIHATLTEIFASFEDPIAPPGVRDENLVHSAAARPDTSLGGSEKYRSTIAKGAALFHSILTNHAFHNGNKRTALVSLAVFLAENHRRLSVSDDEAFEFVTSAAQGFVPGVSPPADTDAFVAQLARWIDDHSIHLQTNARSMRPEEFVRHVTQLGARTKESGQQWVVIGPNSKSIRINKKAKSVPGSAVRVYLSKLGVSEARTGVRFDEFQAGLNPDQALIQALLSVLRRLAYV